MLQSSKWNIQWKKDWFVGLRKEQWDSDGYLEGTTWGLYPWAAKLPKSPFMQVKWETNKYAGVGNAMHRKLYTKISILKKEIR